MRWRRVERLTRSSLGWLIICNSQLVRRWLVVRAWADNEAPIYGIFSNPAARCSSSFMGWWRRAVINDRPSCLLQALASFHLREGSAAHWSIPRALKLVPRYSYFHSSPRPGQFVRTSPQQLLINPQHEGLPEANIQIQITSAY